MNTTEIRELKDADLDLVTGAWNQPGWHYCSMGSKVGGSDGMYPTSVPCSKGQMTDLAELVLATAAQGRVILSGGGSGSPA